MRTYTIKPGRTEELIRLFTDHGLPLYQKYCGSLVGYYTSESGTLNQVVHLWAYRDVLDREVRRARLAEDPLWRVYLDQSLPLVEHQESRILRPTSFSPTIELAE
ncbi:NIPSNAP family protein [Herbiconiux sp. CPCC 203407]|uniref:NIPSNAP family protein n=2 Tax=Herbiconiux oxytropis TaxID=2970915 RepID=A0AA42BSY8_9MICO|nr:NIPSNAP family protein [Herbiconiux oxytropis]MCS5724656.1 NIPSNAP family protein [Herbiconiux oxytropis]